MLDVLSNRTFWVAYAAILSTVVFLWNVTSYLMNKRVRLRVTFEMAETQKDGTIGLLKAASKTSFPINIRGVGFYVYRKKVSFGLRKRLGYSTLNPPDGSTKQLTYRDGFERRVTTMALRKCLNHLGLSPDEVMLQPYIELTDGSRHAAKRLILPWFSDMRSAGQTTRKE